MKLRSHFSGFMAGLCLFPAVVLAQDSPAVGAAAREEAEANARRMNTKIEQLEDTLQAQQKRLNTVIAEIHALREQMDASNKRNELAAIKESVKGLASKIEEVDRKRLADNKLIVERIEALGKAITTALPAPDAAPRESDKPDKGTSLEASTSPKKAQTYKVKKGETLRQIVARRRAQGYKVTDKQIADANPGVDLNNLQVGQTIYFPAN